jgi:hypothetical protein
MPVAVLECLTKTALIPRISTCGAGSIEVDLTDAADIVLGEIPSPRRDGVPLLDLHFHVVCAQLTAAVELIYPAFVRV